ncbi:MULTISPECIES: helix-turn-helix domain-containing protein [Caproicibacterium]|uniref:Helix-turn-helix transcriptional regulator n=1 Tax=Caproicibacterium argilliputei TaxID=3030016 RepID=A0AA97H134_9FIRM|nr:helix-turn-helix transcriptional regulator [Caproicibacterium argilliputei]WOC32008.1 helix-turn-helix transcriptional regulator [Caproicibacterium argilliputei]
MNSHFPRIITLLRKERGLSQKAVAESLGVSQALLSHYEKGIRECGLDFVVKIADFYDVSCDYLLGRTPHPTGATVQIAQPAAISRAAQESMGQALLFNSLSVLYSILGNCGNEDITNETSAYLFCEVYRLFRTVYSANPKNPQGMFTIREKLADGRAAAGAEIALSNICCLLSGEDLDSLAGLPKSELPALSPEKLSESYPSLVSSLFTLLQQAELRMGAPTAAAEKPKKKK